MSVKKRRKIIFCDRIIKKDDSITAQIFKKDEYMRSLGSQRMSEIGRFILVGGGSFLLDYGLLYVFTEFAGIPYLYSSALSFSVSVIINYWLCVVYVFPGARHQTMTRAILFFASSWALTRHACGFLWNRSHCTIWWRKLRPRPLSRSGIILPNAKR